MSCECGNKLSFEECCGKFLNGKAKPSTAEELMRSRFVAFGLGNFDYLAQTQVEPLSPEVRQGKLPEWESLQIIGTTAGGPQDPTGVVEFIAHYHSHGCHDHHEKARFSRIKGEWKYLNGEFIDHGTTKRSQPKVGRNDPCPCGSGRKYKRCCGI